MTISTQEAVITVLADGVSYNFAFNFLVPFQDDGSTPAVKLLIFDASGAETEIPQIDYSITGAGVPAGGYITYPLTGSPLTVGYSVCIARDLYYTQAFSFANQGFLPSEVEASVDSTEMQLQQIQAQVERAIRVPLTDILPVPPLPVLANRVNKYAYFGGDGAMTAISGSPISPEDPVNAIYPDVDPTGVIDASAEWALAEASALPGQAVVLPAGTIRITQPFVSTRQRFVTSVSNGGRCFIDYDGANTTVDIMTIGDGATAIGGAYIGDMTIRSRVTMTGGAALRLNKVKHSRVYANCQGQTAYEADGNRLWDGIWFNEVDNVVCGTREIVAQNKGVKLQGGVGAGLKADLWLLDGMKIARCAVGIHCGGAFGGLYMGYLALGTNGRNLLIDQALAAEANREVFTTGTAFDLTTTGPSVDINDAGGLLLQMDAATWIASAATHGMHVRACNGRIHSFARVYNNGLVSTGDGIRVDAVGVQVLQLGMVHNNSGWGINPNVANNNVAWGSLLCRDNTLGAINPANPSLLKLDLGQTATIGRLEFTGAAQFGDPNCYVQLQASSPTFAVDANDFYAFDRTNNIHGWYLGSVLQGSVSPFGVQTPAKTVAALGSAATAGGGTRSFVTDATVTVFNSIVIGGGANPVPVFSDNTNWRIG